METFKAGIDTLQTLVTAIGVGFGVFGLINLAEGYGSDNPIAKSQGIKQAMAGGGIVLLAIKVIPLLKNLFPVAKQVVK